MRKFISTMLLTGGLLFCVSCEKENVENTFEDSRFVEEIYELPDGKLLHLQYDGVLNSYMDTDDYKSYIRFVESVEEEGELITIDDGSGILRLNKLSDEKLKNSQEKEIIQKSTVIFTQIGIFEDKNAKGYGVTLNVTNENPSYQGISLRNADCIYGGNGGTLTGCGSPDTLYKRASSIKLKDNSRITFHYRIQVVPGKFLRRYYSFENSRYDPLNPGFKTINFPSSVNDRFESILIATTYY